MWLNLFERPQIATYSLLKRPDVNVVKKQNKTRPKDRLRWKLCTNKNRQTLAVSQLEELNVKHFYYV